MGSLLSIRLARFFAMSNPYWRACADRRWVSLSARAAFSYLRTLGSDFHLPRCLTEEMHLFRDRTSWLAPPWRRLYLTGLSELTPAFTTACANHSLSCCSSRSHTFRSLLHAFSSVKGGAAQVSSGQPNITDSSN